MRETRELPKSVIKTELGRAKEGCSSATDFICRYVWELYGYRIRKLFSNDTIDDGDDLQQIFWIAVVAHIPKLDHRGDQIYHLGQRGFWRVGSYIRRKKAMDRILSLDAPYGEDEGMTLGQRHADPSSDTEGIVLRQLGGEQQVDMILNLELAPIAQRALDAIMSGEAGDPDEIGFNKNLAAVLKVSPQRASQAMKSLRSAVTEGVEN